MAATLATTAEKRGRQWIHGLMITDMSAREARWLTVALQEMGEQYDAPELVEWGRALERSFAASRKAALHG